MLAGGDLWNNTLELQVNCSPEGDVYTTQCVSPTNQRSQCCPLPRRTAAYRSHPVGLSEREEVSEMWNLAYKAHTVRVVTGAPCVSVCTIR